LTRWEIFRRGDEVVLRPVTVSAAAIFDALAGLPDDFMPDGRNDTPPQERESF
jgi:antitoxin VapB